MSNRIFVFGSNRQGRHGVGAALEAVRLHGAKKGQGYGRQGNSYAIITKELRKTHDSVSLEEVRNGVWLFLDYAWKNPDLEFDVTPIGCGLAGFKPEQIAPFFAVSPPNVHLPKEFLEVLQKVKT